jgi:hypothetical protein
MVTFKKLLKHIAKPSLLFFELKKKLKTTDTNNFLKTHFKKKVKKKNQTFKAIYDLNFNSLSYNFTSFLILSQIYCVKNDFENFEVILVNEDLPEEKRWKLLEDSYGVNILNFRKLNFIPNLVSLSPKCNGFSVINNRSELSYALKIYDSFPAGYGITTYGVKNGMDLALFKYLKANGVEEELTPPDHSIKIVNHFFNLYKKKIITFTIRNSNFDPSRNSKLKDIEKFIIEFKDTYQFILVPDSDNPYLPEELAFGDNELGFMAAFNPGIRLALYQSAFLNFFSDNGCFTLAAFSKSIKYIAFDNTENSVLKDNLKDLNLNDLFDKGGQYHWANKNQILIHGIDNYENLKKGFVTFEKNLLK